MYFRGVVLHVDVELKWCIVIVELFLRFNVDIFRKVIHLCEKIQYNEHQ